MYFQCTMLPIYLYFSHVFPMFFSYFITDVLIFGMFAFRLSISVQVSKKMFGKINKRRNPNKHWGGWKKIQSLANLGERLFSTQAYFETQVLSLPCKEKKFTWIFFLYNEKNFPQKIIGFTVWLFSSNKCSSTKQSLISWLWWLCLHMHHNNLHIHLAFLFQALFLYPFICTRVI